MTLPTRRGRNWASKRRSGRWSMRCAPGSSATGCRWRCTWIGRTCTSARPRRKSGCAEKSRSRSLGACAKLGIAVIAANSPQAKGRVERIHGTHQDRLVKKLRRKEISSHQHANLYLEREYLAEHNRRFARTPARLEDYHRRAPRATEMDRIFRLESERTISADWVVRYDNRFFQLQPQSRHYAPAQGKVLVCEGQYGRIAIEYQGRALPWQEIPAPTRPHVLAAEPPSERKRVPVSIVKRKWVPPADHPWREAARRGAQRKAFRQAAAPPRPSLALPCASP